MTARVVAGLDGEQLVEVTVLVAVAPGWHGYDWRPERIATAVAAAVQRVEGLALVEDVEVSA
ncbi:hypothetical protein [Amycolatopsis sp. NBC_01480]|uniref:hypothetical protein n=1 Tax=Amycolatopsis sp. NBC_01480 TaxID=2903562 RepID=UPI002E2BB754|nr:hypothetical protein [Amycolatopsis sp. NBC_01480]